jgi:replicative superfamily II helicase
MNRVIRLVCLIVFLFFSLTGCHTSEEENSSHEEELHIHSDELVISNDQIEEMENEETVKAKELIQKYIDFDGNKTELKSLLVLDEKITKSKENVITDKQKKDYKKRKDINRKRNRNFKRNYIN